MTVEGRSLRACFLLGALFVAGCWLEFDRELLSDGGDASVCKAVAEVPAIALVEDVGCGGDVRSCTEIAPPYLFLGTSAGLLGLPLDARGEPRDPQAVAYPMGPFVVVEPPRVLVASARRLFAIGESRVGGGAARRLSFPVLDVTESRSQVLRLQAGLTLETPALSYGVFPFGEGELLIAAPPVGPGLVGVFRVPRMGTDELSRIEVSESGEWEVVATSGTRVVVRRAAPANQQFALFHLADGAMPSLGPEVQLSALAGSVRDMLEITSARDGSVLFMAPFGDQNGVASVRAGWLLDSALDEDLDTRASDRLMFGTPIPATRFAGMRWPGARGAIAAVGAAWAALLLPSERDSGSSVVRILARGGGQATWLPGMHAIPVPSANATLLASDSHAYVLHAEGPRALRVFVIDPVCFR